MVKDYGATGHYLANLTRLDKAIAVLLLGYLGFLIYLTPSASEEDLDWRFTVGATISLTLSITFVFAVIKMLLVSIRERNAFLFTLVVGTILTFFIWWNRGGSPLFFLSFGFYLLFSVISIPAYIASGSYGWATLVTSFALELAFSLLYLSIWRKSRLFTYLLMFILTTIIGFLSEQR